MKISVYFRSHAPRGNAYQNSPGSNAFFRTFIHCCARKGMEAEIIPSFCEKLFSKNLPIFHLKPGPYAGITIRDTGHGMDESLFEAHPERFDLIITDVTMPNITGDELAVKLKKIRKEIPIIVCTGYIERITKERIKAIGISELAMKPILKAEMAVAVRKSLDNSWN